MKNEKPADSKRLSRDIFLWSHWMDLTEPGMTAEKAHALADSKLGQDAAGNLDAFQRYLSRKKITNTGPTPLRLAYSYKETATLLGVGYVSVWRLVKRGFLKPNRALRVPRIAHTEIERFLRDTK